MSQQTQKPSKKETTFALEKDNYKWMLGGIAALIIGYVLMSGGKAEDPSVFNPEIFNTRRLYIAPLLVLIGYGLVFFSIVKKPKD